ncbi:MULTISPECIES: DHA2 family efflux MFS transporter permease subunit [unclassified Actinomyces]|uniref:DHA2 family efflux MFS transporter permease subunit n=1 Tax=unclassified Actinomyces TaxID=2609248 RepID=UPI002018097A|nr:MULTISPECIES: DHA2 family efflux MFS transporter permease subunit [unclassified Actinomyces]MCL3777464.1 DHA2 family efflux MFS transporter permease subunit [Actinomyces sp. AC-20-1]MCL3790166.1 DHA2 family efflux MFS transporter permease subunit [Actinomyces sp. 187325]MCL3792291.1 DHA2 family efflux MFS transporter permease subunit [Actinomyces sp. 186855]MCL3794880.1 DHA2 family efflux MFS transporter permease subunit [Actinomyces sp. 217892]
MPTHAPVNPYKVAAVVMIGSFMAVLDGTIINVAIPALQNYYAAADGTLPAYSSVAWTITGYALATAAIIPLTDYGLKRIGHRWMYIGSILLFTAASVACALAPSLGALIALRVIQGLCGGCIMPVGTALVASVAGDRLGRMMSLMGIPMLIAPIIGPILGGWLVEAASWHWVFLINVPFGLAAAGLGLVFLPRAAGTGAVPLDRLGVLLMSPGLALVLWGVSNAGSGTAVTSPAVWLPLVLGLAMVALFVRRSLTLEHPLLDLTILRLRPYRTAILLAVAFQAAFTADLLLLPSYFQQVRGMGAMAAGLFIAPTGLGALITMPVAASMIDRLAPRRVIPWGMGAMFLSVLLLTQVGAGTSLWYLAAIMTLQGLGIGGTMMPVSAAALQAVPRREVGNATTLFNIGQQVFGAVGIAVVSVALALLLAATDLGAATVAGELSGQALEAGRAQAAGVFARAFWVPTLFMGIALLLAFRLPGARVVPEGEEPAEVIA